MTSRVGQRALSAAAGAAILLLVILIAVSWSVVVTRRGADETDVTPSLANNSTRPQATKIPSKAGDLRNKPQNMEYVIPIKISPPPLHEDDLLYGGEDWDMSPSWTLQPGKAAPVKDGTKPALHTPLHVETGHFRHKAAELWDPHPQYKFTAFGHVFHLVLAQDSSFVAPNLQVMHLWHNYTTRESEPLHATACFYTGKVSGEPQSSVAVNLCHGMTGHIRTSSGNYFIEPMEKVSDHTKSVVHAMYIVPTRMTTNNTAGYESHRCGFTGEESTSHKDEWHAPINERSKRAAPHYSRNGRKKRPKRREYVVEVMVVADKKMAEYHGSELKDYVLTLMSIVAKLYKDPSIGNPISIAVVTLVDGDFQFVSHDTSPYGRKHDGTSATALMRSFCSWQRKHNPYDDSHPKHHDTALLLTRENICRSPSEYKCETLGLAELGTMCDTNSSCAIVQDNGLSAAFTIAHEIGHVLNMPHDDAEDCKLFSKSHITNNVMSRMLDGTTSPWSWSACSRHFLTEYLEAGKAGCLLDSPSNSRYNTEFSPYNLPGENFTVDRQCELVFGAGSRNCSYMPVCERLWCTTGLEENQGCRTKHMPWADGTTCSKGKWCQRGVCVPRDRYALMPVNGSWGPWQKYGECSRTCGGGVKRSIRECNNPPPANGGRYCMGPRMRFQSCATKECPKGAKDFRELQCAAYNNNTFGFRGLPKDVKWVPKYGTSPEERCKLYCRVMHSSSYYRLKDKVIDGTPCGPDTFDICVNGMCKPAGCNHELGSKAKLDMCGQCNGNNTSCQRIVGSFNISKDGYNDVVRIPVGSINVDVRQIGYQGSNADGNYLALLDGTTREYILNGGFVLTVFRKIMSINGVKLEYSGSSAVIERLNSSKPLKKDIIIQILSVGKHPPDISYEYMIRCHWKHNDTWTKCDRPCSGNMYRKPVCSLLDGNEGVPESCCAEMPKPRPQIKHCNTHCSIRWRKTPITACSSSCGRGYRTVSFQCVQEFPNHQSRTINNSICAQHFPMPSTTEECEEPCKGQWKFGEWGVCTKTCGGGYQYRLVECVNESGRPINESLCDSSERITKQACSREACLHWELGEWTPCSVSCGVGERHRSYWCKLNNLIVSPQECRMLPIPSHRERCSVDYCSVGRSGSWQQKPHYENIS
ncbi:A disintegrin and metalloproteinase with thrombospondin motifs 4 isoform X2 [Anabrus simplex]|uniref:A disintegrin and metalloproteinase with thrombospondin motifs 4 isoform X2 n=1 Tax=Anabrus simplex TaxID=316456 RepID=UPI0035A30866